MDKYDTFSRRLFAGFIDGLVFVPIYFLDDAIKKFSSIPFLVIGLILVYTSSYVYSIFFHWRYGQTLGKMAMKVRVVDVSEVKLLTLRQSFMRDSVFMLIETLGLIILIFEVVNLGFFPSHNGGIDYYLSSLGFLWFLVEIVTMLTNNKKRAFHDLMAGSVVINEEFWNAKP